MGRGPRNNFLPHRGSHPPVRCPNRLPPQRGDLKRRTRAVGSGARARPRSPIRASTGEQRSSRFDGAMLKFGLLHAGTRQGSRDEPTEFDCRFDPSMQKASAREKTPWDGREALASGTSPRPTFEASSVVARWTHCVIGTPARQRLVRTRVLSVGLASLITNILAS